MIHVTVRCSWCDTPQTLAGAWSSLIDIADDLPVVEHEGEPYAFCSDECRYKAADQLGADW